MNNLNINFEIDNLQGIVDCNDFKGLANLHCIKNFDKSSLFSRK